MKYTVKQSKTLQGKDVYEVYDKTIESKDDWVYEVYLLDIAPNEDGDIILPYLDFLNENYPSFIVERGSVINPQTKSFTGLSTIHIFFSEKEDASAYAKTLNGKLK